MSSAPERKVVTNWLHTQTQTISLSGKLIYPDGAGWQSDSSKVGSEFIPYTVITPQTGTPVNPSFGDPSQDWDLSYVITTYGVDDDQVEDLADELRAYLLTLKKIDLTMSSSTWRVTTIRCNSIGGVGYTTAIEPTAFSQTDSYTLSLSRSLP